MNTMNPFSAAAASNDDLPGQQSLYVTLCRLFRSWNPSLDELRASFGVLSKLSVFHLKDDTLSRLATPLALSREEITRQVARGLKLAKNELAFIHADLRYCPDCLKAEFHAPVFQHRALEICPTHGCKLRRGCRYCGMPIQIGIEALARSPFACDDCGVRLATPGKSKNATSSSIRLDQWSRAVELSQSNDSSVEFVAKCCATPARLRFGEPTSGAVVRRHLVWGPYLVGQSRPRDFKVECEDDGDEMRSPTPMRVALDRLREIVEQEVYLGPPPNAVRSLRTKDEMTVASAAFWSTVNAYVSIDEYRRGRTGTMDALPSYGPAPLDAENVRAVVSLHEVIGLMARQMMAFRRYEFTAQIDWEVIPEPEMFVPAWRRDGGAARTSFMVRPASAPAGLRFLLRRIGRRTLAASYFSIAQQCLVPIDSNSPYR